MDETKRFLRYVTPGLAFPFQIILILFLNDNLSNLKEYSDIGTGITAFFASGIIGFLFSNVYYVIHWTFCFPKWDKLRILDYKKLVKDNKALFSDYKDLVKLNQRNTWSYLSAYTDLNHYKKLVKVEKKTESISNILVSIGTTFWVVTFGLVVGIWFVDCESMIYYFLLNFFFMAALFWNYQLVADTLQVQYEQIYIWISKRKRGRKSKG